MKTDFTEQDVIKAKLFLQGKLKDDAIDLSYISVELLSKQHQVRAEKSLHDIQYGNTVSDGPNAVTGQPGYYFFNDGNDIPCGLGQYHWVPEAGYAPSLTGQVCNNGSPVMKFTSK